jgi:hypothetical protein
VTTVAAAPARERIFRPARPHAASEEELAPTQIFGVDQRTAVAGGVGKALQQQAGVRTMDIRVSGHQMETGEALRVHVEDRLNTIVDKHSTVRCPLW